VIGHLIILFEIEYLKNEMIQNLSLGNELNYCTLIIQVFIIKIFSVNNILVHIKHQMPLKIPS